MSKANTVKLHPPFQMTQPEQSHKVFIKDLLIDMLIGVYAHEKSTPQPVRLSIEMTVNDSHVPLGDDYHNVVCYDTIASAVKNMAEQEHVNLVETLAEKVAMICLNYERVSLVRVTVEKLNAIENTASVGVEILRGRQ